MNEKNDNEKKPQPDLRTLIAGIQALKPNPKKERDAIFAELLPTIEEALDRKISQKALLKFLADNGLAMSPNTLRAKLDAAKGGKPPAA